MKTLKSVFGILIITAVLALQVQAQLFLTNGLVAYYPFNGNANDASGNGNDANVQGTYQYLANGTLHLIGDGSLYYSGGGYVALPNFGNLNSGFTISIWVANETDHGTSIYGEYYVWFDNNNPHNVAIGQHDIYVQDGLASVDFPYTIANYTPWKQLVLVYSPTNSAAYLNGAMVGSTNNVTINPFPMVNSAIGRHWWNGGTSSSARMTMDVKDFRIYNRALSSSEVSQLHSYESVLQPPAFLTNGLLAYYPFNGNANDASGNGNNGFVSNAALTTNMFGNAHSAYFFNGSNSVITSTITNLPVGASPRSISLWAQVIPLQNNPVLACWGLSPENEGFGIINNIDTYNNDKEVWYGWLIGDTYDLDSGALVDGNWHNVVVEYDGTNLSMFMDGTLDASAARSPNTGYSDLYIGNGMQNTGQPFNGNICNLRIYNRALSSNEVSELYAYESQPPVTPNITSQPQPITINAGDNASFTVAATGSPPLSYQWSLNNTNIQWATNSTLTISNVDQTDLGTYAVVVSNSFGSTNSSNAILSMYPYLESPFSGDVVDWGQNTTLSVGAWGTGPLSYQWFDNGVAIQNATNQTLNLTDIQFTNAGLYSVVLSNPLGSVTNTPEQLVVNVAGVSLGFSPTLTINGIPGFTYVIQSSTNLANTNAWITLTNLTLTQTQEQFIDTSVNASSPQNPRVFYQILPGQ